jgi:hypothetical protein
LGCGAFCGVFLVFNLETDKFLCLKVYEEDNKTYYEKETTAFTRLSEIDEFYKQDCFVWNFDNKNLYCATIPFCYQICEKYTFTDE